MLSKLFTRQLRPAWGALIVVALVAACTTLAPMRAWAEKVLGLLRINKVAVISVDTNQLKFNEGQFGRQVGQLLSDTVVVTKEPREPQRVASVDEASQQAGFKVRVFSARADEPELLVQQGTAFHMTLDRARLQAIIDSVGDTHLSLPDSIDGATVSVDVPRSVSAAYGERPTSHGGANAYTEWDQYIHFMQIPTPTVITPPDFNIAEVAVIGLQLLGMSAAEARDFSQTVDWTSTLVVPIPMGVTRHETVDVDGVKGTLITENQRGRRPAKYVLLWVKDGIIYSLMGYGDFSQAVTLANSLE